MYYRLLLRLHDDADAPGSGPLTKMLATLPEDGRRGIENPDPAFLRVLDYRLYMNRAALAANVEGRLNQFNAELLAAAIYHGAALRFAYERNVSPRLVELADKFDLDIDVAS